MIINYKAIGIKVIKKSKNTCFYYFCKHEVIKRTFSHMMMIFCQFYSERESKTGRQERGKWIDREREKTHQRELS